jgi:hypothetical protein
MRKLLLVFLALPCFAAINNPRVSDTTAREAILRYVAPTPAACSVEVSESASYSPLVNDVNPGLFVGSNSDFRNGAQGRERTFVIGGAGTGIDYAPVDTTGKRSSRALQANTLHYYRVTCGVDVISGTFNTSNIAPGDTFPTTTAPIDPAHLGDTAWPFFPWSGAAGIIDPVTGAYTQQFWRINAEQAAQAGPYSFTYAYDEAGTWTNKNNVLANDSAVATYTGAGNDPIKVTLNSSPNGNGPVTGLTLYVKGYVDNVTTTLEACLMIDGATCYGPWITVPALPVGSLGATVEVGDPSIWATTVNTPSMMGAWLNPNQQIPGIRDLSSRSGYADNIGAAVKLRYTGSANGAFDSNWTANTHIIYGGVDYKVASVTTGTALTLASAPADGTSVAWSAQNYGFLVHKKSAGGTLNIDYLGVTPSVYIAEFPNNGSGGSRQCTTSRYHSGWRIGGPIGGTYNAATNTSPIVIHTSSPFNDLTTGDKVFIRDVPGNTAANGTWTITVIDSQNFSLNSSTGNGTFPSDAGFTVWGNGGGMVWKTTSPTGHVCYISDSGGSVNLYWVNPDTTPADVRYLGPGWTYNADNSVSAAFGVLNELDPQIPYIYKLETVSGKQELFRGRYIGNQNYGVFQDVGPNAIPGGNAYTAVWAFTELTPAPNTITDKLVAFDATATGLGVSMSRSPKSNLLALNATLGQQNTRGWLGVYDINTNSIIGLMNSWSNSNARYCGIHTPLAWEGADKYSWVPYEINYSGAAYQGPYRILTTSGAVTAVPTDCAAQLTAISASNPLGVTGNNCTTITVSSNIPITPPDANPANDTLGGQVVRVGDVFRFYTGTSGSMGNYDGELGRLVGFSGTTFVVQRNYAIESVSGALASHASGFYLHEFCTVFPRWWDYTNAPHGETGTDPYSQNLNGNVVDRPMQDESHYFTRNGLSVADVAPGPVNPTFAAKRVFGQFG